MMETPSNLNPDPDAYIYTTVDTTSSSLAMTNGHVRDADITFFEEGHIYDVKGDTSFMSATTFVHSFFEEFDADKVIQSMKRSATWKTKEYYGMTDEEIKLQWETNGNVCSRLGTLLHLTIEHYYNNWDLPTTVQPEEYMRLFHPYEEVVKSRGWIPYRSEWCVYDEIYKISGSIDMLYQLPPPHEASEVVIVDWKRCKKLKDTNPYAFGKHPLTLIADCNYWHYILQLNLYRWILQTHYGKKVCAMYVVLLHPNQKTYIEKKLPVVEAEILEMLFERACHIKKERGDDGTSSLASIERGANGHDVVSSSAEIQLPNADE
jgi:hypothetical protein